ncbi:MAG: non-homologous end-joining DNA ligase [Solirubrobacterales bacterium]
MPPKAKYPEEERIVDVDGRRLTIKHLSKVLYPETGTTKAEVLNYYARAAEVMLPHISERAVTLKRYPHGVDDMSFFEKACPKYRPEWLKTAGIYSKHRGEDLEYCMVNEVASLIYLANLGTIEFHVLLSGRRSPQKPKTMVYDLDPGEGMDILDCARVALIVRERLLADGLESWIKTSGSKGMQLYVPLNRPRMTFDRTKTYSKMLADELAAEFPGDIVSKMSKSLRRERVFIDWSQNDAHKTTICAYSLRGRPIPRASTPVTWDEVADAVRAGTADPLVIEMEETLERIEADGDLFEGVLTLEQGLPRRR